MVHLNDHRDSFRWTASKNFSVKNMYNDLVIKSGTPVNCWTWKAKIHLKIKILLWYLKNRVVLTKDNLVKRQWKGYTKCCFCTEQETIHTCFFILPRLDLCGGLFVLHLIAKPVDVGHLLRPWLTSFSNKQRNLVGWRHYVGPYGSVGMI
jgi:hypothetical protein